MHSKLVIALACGIAASAFGISLNAIAKAKPQTVVFYKFDKGTAGAPIITAIDSSKNHLDATVTGSLTYSSELPPRQGGKYSLDATSDYDYASVADTPLLDLTTGFTLSAWVRPTGSHGDASPGDYIVTKDLTTGFGNCLVSYGIEYDANANLFSASISGSSDPAVPCVSVGSKDTFPLGQWHYVSMQYTFKKNKAVLSLFVDGVKEGQTVAKNYPGIAYGGAPFLIGAANFGSGDHDSYRRNFVGNIDDVEITLP